MSQHLHSPSLPLQLLEAVAESLSVYYNSSGQASCYNTTSTATSSLGSRGWDYQVIIITTPKLPGKSQLPSLQP